MNGPSAIELNIVQETKSVISQLLPSNSYRQLNTLPDDECNVNNNPSDPRSESKNSEICLIWKDLTYTVPKDTFATKIVKKIISAAPINTNKRVLHPQSGHIKQNEICAIIGQSGSGKSSLLECLSGGKKLKDSTGSIKIRLKNTDGRRKQVDVCYIPQDDHLMTTLTLRETLQFALKLKSNRIFMDSKCENIINSVLESLNLVQCADTLVSKISGGQKKRLSIGLELLGKPNIMILDEPTSGLDSTNALSLIRLLHKLCQSNNLAILASMHQPSAKILQLFHKIYLLSFDGRLIYYGSYANLTNHLIEYGLHCPAYHNPADFAIEIASGEYGIDKIEALENGVNTGKIDLNHTTLNEDDCYTECFTFIDIKNVVNRMLQKSQTSFARFLVLLNRSLLTTLRDPCLNTFRLSQHIFIALIIILVYSNEIGSGNGCLGPSSSSSSLVNASSTAPSTLTLEHLQSQENLTSQNLALMFFSIMFLTFAAMMPTVMVFPIEMLVFKKERKNAWYSCASFYLAKTFADLPYQLFYTISYVVIVFFGTGQEYTFWRFNMFLLILILISLIGQTVGLLFGAIFIKYLQTAIFVAPVSTLPLILISGFFVKVHTMPALMKHLANLSYLKAAFEALVVATYGYDRCTSSRLEGENLIKLSSTPCSLIMEVYRHIRYDLNITYREIRSPLKLYLTSRKKNLSTLDSYVEKLENFDVNSTLNNYNADESLVMQEFGLKNSDLVTNIGILLIFIFFLRTLTYFILQRKSGRKTR